MAGVQPLPLCHQLAFARLWLDPIFWTRSHIRKLGCQFENADADHTDYTKATNGINSTPWTRLSMATSPSLTELFVLHPNPANRLDCFREILGIAGPWERGLFPDERYGYFHSMIAKNTNILFMRLTNSKTSQGAPFVFQSIQPSSWVDYKIFYYRKHMRAYPEESPPRLIGFLDYRSLEKHRKSRFKPKKRHRSGSEEYDYSGLERVTPRSWMEDPFLLFILLGIAQLHRRKCKGASFHKGLMVCSRLVFQSVQLEIHNSPVILIAFTI